MEQDVQTDATFNIQQCWELLASNVASVSTGLLELTKQQLCTYTHVHVHFFVHFFATSLHDYNVKV